MTDCPCKDCPNRHPACHASCPDYAAWKEISDRERDKRNAERETQTVLWNQQREAFYKFSRHNRDRRQA